MRIRAKCYYLACVLAFGLVQTAAFAVVRTTLNLPARQPGALTGTQFKDQILTLARDAREEQIYQQIAAGNVPDFMRTMIPITVTATISGQSHTVTYYVTPDYMAIGSNADFFRMPMSAPLAQRVADLVNGNLPTRKMVNDIWTNATIKLSPQPISPSAAMITVPVFWDHNVMVEASRAGYSLGPLIAGIKKDVVVTAQIATHQAYVAIYGWHYLSGSPIQPLYMGHEATYADYSHGIRIVNQEILVDGSENTVVAVLASATLSPLLSDEGAFTCSRYPIPGVTPTPTPTSVPNLANNGSFEGTYTGGVCEGWTPWQASGSAAITYGRASLNKYDGSYAQYWDRGDTTAFDGGVYQRVSVTPGATYDITAWMKRQSTFAGTLMAFGYDPAGGTDGLASTVVYQDLTGTSDNVSAFYAATARASAGAGAAITLFARGGHSGTTGGTNAYFYLDAVTLSLKEAPTTAADRLWILY